MWDKVAQQAFTQGRLLRVRMQFVAGCALFSWVVLEVYIAVQASVHT